MAEAMRFDELVVECAKKHKASVTGADLEDPDFYPLPVLWRVSKALFERTQLLEKRVAELEHQLRAGFRRIP